MKAGWSRYRLDECTRIVGGATPASGDESCWGGDICWATPKDLSDIDGTHISDTPRKLTQYGLESCSSELLPPGSVLFSSRAPIGHVAINTVPMATNQGFKSFIPNPKLVHAPFLFWWLRSNRAYLESLGNGATFKEVSKAVVSRIEIDLPQMEEQRRIADFLDRTDSLRAKRRVAFVHLAELTEAIFVDMFGAHRQTPVTIGDRLERSDTGWSWELLTDLGRLATGHTPDRKRPEYWGGHIPWVTLTDIRKLDGTIATQTSEGVTEEGIENSSAVKLPPGTVCFSRTASVGFVTVMGKEMATSQDFVNWVCGPKLDPIYLMHAFLLSRERLRSLSTGSTHKTIYFPTVERFRVLVPPLDRQKSFRSVIEKITAIKKTYHTTATETEALFASLQDRAFRGAL